MFDLVADVVPNKRCRSVFHGAILRISRREGKSSPTSTPSTCVICIRFSAATFRSPPFDFPVIGTATPGLGREGFLLPPDKSPLEIENTHIRY